MELEHIKSEVKAQFNEISAALFKESISIQEIEETPRVFAEASPMFGLNILRYSESNFGYFYVLLKYILNTIDIVDRRVLESDFPKLDSKLDLLTLTSIDPIESYRHKTVRNEQVFLELSFVLHLFVFLHECGHLNQEVKPETDEKASSHFSEFNADYYALTKILQYYYTLKTRMPNEYLKKIKSFGSEKNLILLVITTALLVVFLNVLSEFNSPDTKTHPAIRKRFCYLIFQSVEQLNDNFKSLFAVTTLKDFAIEIFQTLSFIEKTLISSDEMIFGDLLNFCLTNFDEVRTHLKDNTLFDKFNE